MLICLRTNVIAQLEEESFALIAIVESSKNSFFLPKHYSV